MAVVLDKSYLNQTVNKTARAAGNIPWLAVIHETASPNSSNPHGTLRYNLAASVGSSYHYLIARSGTIFEYLDPKRFIAWHAGVRSSYKSVSGWELNVSSIGIEFDGPNDGTPCTPEQIIAGRKLVQYLWETFGIPCSHIFYPEHTTVSPGYKSDARGIDSAQLVNPLGLHFISPPRISYDKFVQLLEQWQSPILIEANDCWQQFVKAGIDPAVALAFTWHEHKAGTHKDSIIVEDNLLNWGAVRTPHIEGLGTARDYGKLGTYAQYNSWKDSAKDWSQRIIEKYIRDRNLYTVDLAIPTYAPDSDNNNEVAYIRSVRRKVEKWQLETTPKLSQIPSVYNSMADIPEHIKNYWEASGGVWQANRYALGLLVDIRDNVYIFERGRLRDNEGKIDALLTSED